MMLANIENVAQLYVRNSKYTATRIIFVKTFEQSFEFIGKDWLDIVNYICEIECIHTSCDDHEINESTCQNCEYAQKLSKLIMANLLINDPAKQSGGIIPMPDILLSNSKKVRCCWSIVRL